MCLNLLAIFTKAKSWPFEHNCKEGQRNPVPFERNGSSLAYHGSSLVLRKLPTCFCSWMVYACKKVGNDMRISEVVHTQVGGCLISFNLQLNCVRILEVVWQTVHALRNDTHDYHDLITHSGKRKVKELLGQPKSVQRKCWRSQNITRLWNISRWLTAQNGKCYNDDTTRPPLEWQLYDLMK